MRRTSGQILVAVLVVLNAALVVYAFTRHSPPVPKTTVPTPVVHTSHTPKPVPHATVAAASARVVPNAAGYLFSAASTSYAWRATGGCVAPADLAATADGGNSFITTVQPSSHILAIQATGYLQGWAIAANTLCQAAYYVTKDGGRTWKVKPFPSGLWAQTSAGVATPSGTTTTPCPASAPGPVRLTTASPKLAMVLCSRGVFRTIDGGHKWLSAGDLPTGRAAAVAITKSGAGVLAMVGTAGCRGTRILHTEDAGKAWTFGSCLVVATPPIFVGLAAEGDGLLFSAGGVYQTTNFGGSWG